jgi:hypothetical protein
MLQPLLDTQRFGRVIGSVQLMKLVHKDVDDEVGQSLGDVRVDRQAEAETVLGDELNAMGRGVGEMWCRETGDNRFPQIFGGDGDLGEIIPEVVDENVDGLLRRSGAPGRISEEGGIQGDCPQGRFVLVRDPGAGVFPCSEGVPPCGHAYLEGWWSQLVVEVGGVGVFVAPRSDGVVDGENGDALSVQEALSGPRVTAVCCRARTVFKFTLGGALGVHPHREEG